MVLRGGHRSLAPLACAVGAAALAGQTVLVRELMVSFYGTELALVCGVSCWLLFVAMGAVSGAALVRAVGAAGALARLAVVGLALGLQGQFALARLVRPLLGVGVGQFVSLRMMLVGAAAAALPAAFPVGFFFAAACRWQEGQEALPGRGIGRLYVAEALGSSGAGALLSLVLLGRIGAGAVVAGAGGLLLVATAVHAAVWRRPRVALVWVIVGTAGCAGVVAAGPALNGLSVLLRWRSYSTFRLVDARDTRYQHVELGAREGEFVLVRNGRPAGQFPDAAAARRGAALLLTQHPRPRDVLVVGGGLGGLCQQMLTTPIRSLDFVEPDPQVAELLLKHMPAALREPLNDGRFSLYGQDARHFLRRAAEGRARYDLIVVGVGDPTSVADSRYYTVEFCRLVKRMLRSGGVAAFCGVTASENYMRSGPVRDYTGCIYRTVREVFGTVVVRPGDEFCFFASDAPGAPTSEAAELGDRFDRLGLEPAALRRGFELVEFPPERTRWATELLEEGRGEALLSTDARPVAFTLFLAVQRYYAPSADGRRLLSDSADVFARARQSGPAWLLLPFAALLVLLTLVRLGFGRRRAVPVACTLAVLTSGVFGLSAEMLIVYGYQVAFGYVYRDISILVGLFMMGLAAGGWASSRSRRGRGIGTLVMLEALQGAVILAVPAAGAALSFSPYAFMCLAPVAGFLTGAPFPLAARASLRHVGDAGAVAGVLDGADHLGGMIGAACVGLLLVPAVGLMRVAAVLALVKCISMVGLVMASATVTRGDGAPAG